MDQWLWLKYDCENQEYIEGIRCATGRDTNIFACKDHRFENGYVISVPVEDRHTYISTGVSVPVELKLRLHTTHIPDFWYVERL